jgi:hypothetical protein
MVNQYGSASHDADTSTLKRKTHCTMINLLTTDRCIAPSVRERLGREWRVSRSTISITTRSTASRSCRRAPTPDTSDIGSPCRPYCRSIAATRPFVDGHDKRVQVLAALVEGSSINATCRMTGVAKHTSAQQELGLAFAQCVSSALLYYALEDCYENAGFLRESHFHRALLIPFNERESFFL